MALTAVLQFAAPGAGADERPVGDARVLAPVPSPPGFPEGIAVRDGRVYVAGPAAFGTTGKPASRVLAFDRATGALVATYLTEGEDLLAEHANSSIAFDGDGRLYVLNTQLGIYRLDLATGTQQQYASPFPDLPPCLVTPTEPCAHTLADTPSIPNDIAFDDAGNAYVTDSMQATIWLVPAPAGPSDLPVAPVIWFQDRRLKSPYIGANGLRLDPAQTSAYVTVTTDLRARSFVYTLPLVDQPTAADLAVFHRYPIGQLPDGIAFGESGDLYVAMATPGASGVSVLSPTGAEVRRFANRRVSPIAPYDSPANIAFDSDGAILLTNHAFVTGIVDPSRFSVLDVFVDDKGSPLAMPSLP